MYLRAHIFAWLCIAFHLCAVSSFAAPPKDRYKSAREELVSKELVRAGITDRRVLNAVRSTLRHEFVARVHRANAYQDRALPIGAGQTISSPYIVAHMTESLEPKPTDKVLEIGTGSGYQAAILSPLVADVYSIEIVETLGRQAARTLQRLKYNNVHTKIGDGYKGWAEHAPFDKIIVTCSPEKVPQPLIDQLAEGGRIVVPLGQRFQQVLYLYTKIDGKLKKEALENTFFVPMTGVAEDRRSLQIDEQRPQIVNGGFEDVLDTDDTLPKGWFYVRQGKIVQSTDAPVGERYLTVSTRSAGTIAHAIQPFGVDGREIRNLKVSVRAKGENLSGTKDQRAGVFIEFYGPKRDPVGQAQLSAPSADFDWKSMSKTIRVPIGARLGIIGVGLFGTTGTASFDEVQLEAIEIRNRKLSGNR